MKYLLFIYVFLIHLTGFSQTPYGNEWIKNNQPYIKIKISERGVYRINYNQLQSLGFLANNPNPTKFQIFYLGEEIPLNVEGEIDNSFDALDYIEFYAEPNNAKVDEILYKTGEQPNKEISLFNDEAVFFLTCSSSKGKRYENIILNSSGLTPETHIISTASSNFSNQYYPGQYVLDVMTFSDYIEGEGYLGNTFSLGSSQIISLNTPNYFTGSTNFKSTIETYVAGRSNAFSSNTQGNNHHLRINIGNTVIKDTLYRGYKTIRLNELLNISNLNSSTDITFNSVNDLGASTDFQAPGYVRITYPRSLDATNYNFLKFRLNTTNAQALVNFTNSTNWTEAYILDPIINKRYKSILIGSINSFTVLNSNNSLIAYSTSALKSAILENVSFNIVDPLTYNAKMMIVTHPSLLSSVNNLASYKNGRGVSTVIYQTEDIYNQFCYGIHHPLAIRNLSRFLIEKATAKPEYLFLVGKGYEYTKQMLTQDLVPTMGFPPSDNEFTAKIIDNTVAPALATGRLPAKNLNDVNTYLDKLKLYEQQPNELWRKTIINITGGGNSSEDNSFSNYLRNLSNISNKEYFGSSTISYYKSVTDPITDNLTDKINKTIENGAHLVTFLGHGSTTGTAVSVGKAENIQRILFFFINGCSTGNAFTTASLGEEFILQKERGAIGWIGTSSEGVASYLAGLATNLYENSFKSNYGKSIASNISSSIRTYQNQNDALNKIHCQQYIYLGDPSINFYSPNKPDYEITSRDVSITESNITANDPSFNLSLVVRNNGKALLNNVKVRVVRTLNDNSTITYAPQSYGNLFNTDTLKFLIDNSIANNSGLNKFAITIDPDNQLDELNEINNNTEFSFFFASNGLTLISPNPYSIVSNNDISLKIQSNNLFTKSTNYFFEIDTINTFNSNWKKTSGTVNSGLFATWKPNITLEPNKTYYWRARLDADLNNGGQWQSSSFAYIPNSKDGWNQSHYQQFSNITLKNITPEFNFTNTVYPVRLSARGQNSTSTAERRIRLGASNTSPSFRDSNFNGLAIIAIDPIVTTKILNYPSSYNFKNDGLNGTGVFYFNTNVLSDVDSLIYYINRIPIGYNVLGISGLNFAPKTLPEAAKNVFKSLGLSVFEDVNNGEPYIFIGKKGASQNDAAITELKAGITEDVLHLHDIPYPWNSGIYFSEKIGPSNKWTQANVKFLSNNNDNIITSIIGIDNNGLENTLKTGNNLDFDLTDINADTYHYLRIKAEVKDQIDFTAPKLISWKVLHDSYSEISFNPEFKNTFYTKELQEGDSLRIAIGFSNLKQIASDSLQLNYKITKQDRTSISGNIANLKGLDGGQNAQHTFSIPTIGLAGNNVLQLTLNPKNNKDQQSFNNYISYDFKALKDIKSPLIDLLVDGKRIINGEVVSPRPSISVSVADENKFLLLKDTSSFKVYLKKLEVDDYKYLSFSSNKVILNEIGTSENNKASFIVLPGLLDDGTYSLKISAVDISGNGNNSSLVTDFKVINEQTISNFLPYPNPVTNTTRFVFNVTGENVPDKIKIQILTTSGKIVKEILKEELGTISIGNNISDYAWDGTDMFGDRLANGVYFYKVIVQNKDGSSVKNSNNATNKMFKNNVGKIYLIK